MTIKIELSEDEIEMLLDALETDLEGYVDAAKDAHGKRQKDDATTFNEAAKRIAGLMSKLRGHLE